MAEEVIMPKLSMTMEEGEVVKWHKEEGEEVKEGEVLLEVLSDKATLEVEAPASGLLLKKLTEEGESVPVTEIIGVIGEEGEDISDLLAEAESSGGAKEDKEEEKEEVTTEKKRTPVEEPLDSPEIEGKVKASPAARRAAKEKNIELSEVRGTGPGGRRIEEDVMEYAAKEGYRATPAAEKIAAERGIFLKDIAKGKEGRIYKEDVLAYADKTEEVVKEEPLTGLKKAAAKRVTASWQEIPHVTLNTEVDMKNALAVVEKLNNRLDEIKLSVTDLILKAVAVNLAEYPIMNAHIEEDKVIYSQRMNVGLAVDVEGDLTVPVLKDIDQKGLEKVNQEKIRLAKKARNNELTQEELTGSNFAISNLGMYEIEDFSPIINAPGSGILGVGEVKKRHVIIDDESEESEVRPMMKLSLSFDHRLINGAPAAQFLQSIKHILEDPELLLL